MRYLFIFFLATLSGFSACQSQQTNSSTLDALAFNKKIGETAAPIILDVRTEEEFAGGYITGATNLNYNSNAFADAVTRMDKNTVYFVYCLSGGRSSAAAGQMRKMEFKQVYDLKGGLMAWQAQQLPLTQPEKATASVAQMSMSAYEQLTASAPFVLIDFYAPWCGPCKKLEPVMTQIATEYSSNTKVIRINIDEQKSLAAQLGIVEIPLIKIYKNGKLIQNAIGALSKDELTQHLH